MTSASWAFLLDSVPFTKAVVDGETSLGGSESACLGLARALKARGHDIHVFATKLAEDACGADASGVVWHPLDHFAGMNQFIEWDVVVGLRMISFFHNPISARLRLLWNQDLLLPGVGQQVMSIAWALDKSVYVSEYHRQQWEGVQPELAPIGWATKNGYDPQFVPAQATKDPTRIIHISRPERGLAPLLAMWPALRARVPNATLQICRYASMYDGEGSNVRAMCESFDARVARVQAEVGGIEYLGALGKPALYKAIAEAAVMWYPGIAGFAETSCIAAIEAQANGTPFVGSLKGALPETAYPSFEAGLLIAGDAEKDADYQTASVDAVVKLLDGCARQSFDYRKLQQAGRKYVQGYTYGAIAAEWEAQIDAWFAERYKAGKVRVMQQLLHEDDHTAAMVVANEIIVTHGLLPRHIGTSMLIDEREPDLDAAAEAYEFCERVIQGKEQTADDYAAHAIQNPLDEVKASGRLQMVGHMFEGCTRVLDIACGNGAGAIAIALANPEIRVVGIDYAVANIEHATTAAAEAGVGDRCTFESWPVWDFDTDAPHAHWDAFASSCFHDGVTFDGLFVGEFVEHVADCTALVEALETVLSEGALCIYTCPSGPFGELVPRGMPIQRGHVHCFKHDDIKAVWGKKPHFGADFLGIGQTPRLAPIGHWIIQYRTGPDCPAGERDYETRVQRTRPLQRLSIGVIAKDAETDIGRCLASVWAIADEIVLGDTGSTDTTTAIAASYGARVIDLPPIQAIEEGFAGARNAVLDACTGDWFCWIDADELLVQPHLLRRYLDATVYNGFVLHQHHLQLDGAANSYDIPIRLFRRIPSIRFYGCIHEQPQMGDCNTDILPTLEPFDVVIAHTGYLTEGVRREKMLQRNLPMLRRDQEVFPDRELGKLLVLRDYVNLADYDVEAAGGMTVKAQRGYAQAIRYFVTYFDDPAHKFHGLARPWYHLALQRMGVGLEVEVALAGRVGGLQQARAKPERIWVRDHVEFERYMAWRIGEASKRMRDEPVKTDPFTLPQCAAVTA